MSIKEAFHYTMAANHYEINDIGYSNGVTKLPWWYLYAETFDKINLQNSINDEFKRPSYLKLKGNELIRGIQSVDFNKTFSYTTKTTFDKYNMELGYFPIDRYALLRNLDALAYVDEHQFWFLIGKVYNSEDFDLILKMNSSKAESFVSSRKDNSGKVDRTVDVKVIYNVVNQNFSGMSRGIKEYLGIYIQKIIFLNGSIVLGEIKPKVDYYDKVNLIKIKPEETPTITDIDGNVYHTISIGTQVWMVENLKTTKFNDGISIPSITNDKEWENLNTPAYCFYNNDVTNKNIYGVLYNGFAVNTGKLAPKGWHVASDSEWTTLINFLNGARVAGGKLKETGTTHWQSPNSGATNETSFKALPGGYCRYNGTFGLKGESACWWSSTAREGNAWCWRLNSDNTDVDRYDDSRKNGLSIRCIKD